MISKSEPLFSIIVPVYNTEQYLRECIDSILAQTYENFEVILIDDGATDNCPQICDEYAERDSRVKVIHKENGGVSSARNIGIQSAKGKYLLFFDSDDSVKPNTFERLFQLQLEKKADVICYGYYQEYEDHHFRNNIIKKNYFANVPIEMALSIAFEGYNNYPGFERIFPSVWDKAYKREVIQNNNLRFDEYLSKAEDLLFNVAFFCVARNAYMTDESFYIYRLNPNSLIHTYPVFEEERIQKGVYLYSQVRNIFVHSFVGKETFQPVLSARLVRIAININEEIVNSTMNFSQRLSTIKKVTEWLLKYLDKYEMEIKFVQGKKFKFERTIVVNRCILVEFIYAMIMARFHKWFV